MKSNYARKLNKANIILGIHIAFKLVIILTLFIILFTTIWIKQIYLKIIKSSAYIQLFIFLTLALVMLAINNPKQFDICFPYLNYFYVIISILQIGIIISEIYFLVKNMQNFLNVFHECAYYRTYEEISLQDYKRTCLYYITDYNNELPYKYICYYNSENEYQNKFCDGIFCKKNNNKNEINTYIKCYGNVDVESINFSGDNEFYLKEIELIHKYKSSNLYACFRKEKLIKDENIFNQNCPDSNPIKKMIIFIYSDILLHLIDFLFIYEFFLFQKTNEIYSNLVLLQSRAPLDYLPTEEELRNNSNTKKETLYTDNKELMAHPQTFNTFYNQREISQTIIIEPGFKNNNIINLKKEDRKDLNLQNEYINIEINNDAKKEILDENDDDIVTNENNGVINRKSKIFKLKKKNNEFNEENEIKNNRKKMIIIDIKKDEELGINRMNFFIRKKTRKKRNRKNKNQDQDQDKDSDSKTNKNNHYSDEQLTQSTNMNEQNKEDNKLIKDNNKSKKIRVNKNEIENKTSLPLNENKNNKLRKTKLIKNIFNLDMKNNSNILLEKKNNNFMVNFKKEFSENNLYTNSLKRNNSGDKIIHNSLKNDIKKNSNINKNRNLQINEEKTKKKKNKNLFNSTENEEIKEDEKEAYHQNFQK